MRPGPHVPASQALILDGLADHIDKVLDAFYDFGVRTKWESSPDSPLDSDRRRLRRQYGPNAYWTEEAANYAAGNGVLFTAVAGQHLEALRVVLRERHVVFPPATVSRPILEIAGHVFWLLDPNVVSVRDRAARAWLARLHDATRQKTAALTVEHPDAPKLGGAVRNIRRKELPDRFYPSEIGEGDRGTIRLRGQSYPGLEEALEYIGKASGVPWNTSGMYSYLSNASHPTLHVIADSLHETDGKPTGFGLEDVTLPYRISRMAIMCFVRCWQVTAAYHGLDHDEPGDLGEEIEELPAP